MPTDIIMTVHGLPEVTRRCLASLKANTEHYRLIVVDSASKEHEMMPMLQREADVVIRYRENVSCPRAVNEGIELSRSPVVVVTNNDIEFTKDWLFPLVHALHTRANVGIIQPYNTVGELPKDFPNFKKEPDLLGDVPKNNFIGCCFAIRWSDFQYMKAAQGGFDEQYDPFGFDDRDFYLAMGRHLGLKAQTHFGSYVHHYSGCSMGQMTVQERDKITAASKAKFIAKWGIEKFKEFQYAGN